MLFYGATTFLSALLLFLVQPLIGKYILPWFGGTPAVWTTCLLFFQALLLGGYSYAHALARRWPLRRQALVHLLLLAVSIVAVVSLSIIPSPAWKPMDDQSPVLRILGLLSVSIGAPYLLLSSTSPLLQSWFSRMRPGSSPYRLYALSNLGSLLAILSYSFLIEPGMRLSRQASIWSWAYIAFALMCILLSLNVMRSREPEVYVAAPGFGEVVPDDTKPGPARYVLWLSLTACSSIMLLATTSQMCLDLAVVPLLWILPLALYLLSFILCFQHERLYWRPLFIGGLAASIAWTCFVLFGGVFAALRWQILSYSLTLFACCMVCHGELVRLRPGPRYLTSFYLMVAGGGTLGAILVTLGAPHLLKDFWEYHFGLFATALLTLIVLFRDRKSPLYQGRRLVVWALWALLCAGWAGLAIKLYDNIWHSWKYYAGLFAIVLLTLIVFWRDRKGRLYGSRPLRVWAVWAALSVSCAALAFVLVNHIRQSMENSVETRRNFFGVLRVLELNKDDPAQRRFTLMHGRIEHGFQFQDAEKRYWPTSYYGPDSGVGLAIRYHPRRQSDGTRQGNLRIGVIGLGTGTLACYGQEGDYIRFYEINPEVIRLSDKYFTYRKDSPARIEVVLGDARVSMERERQRRESQNFDVLAVDAFSSDAIPVHLLTRECFQNYLFHLKEDGILAIHISNRYFDLGPVVRNLITPDMKQNMQAFWIDGRGNESQGTDATDWVLLTSNQLFLSNPDIQKNITAWNDPAPPARFWTDDYSNLFSLLRK
ncbi:MAG: fused MFS/spermidine synthase [Acidobacteriota bacterium]|jgi:hypothetical protein